MSYFESEGVRRFWSELAKTLGGRVLSADEVERTVGDGLRADQLASLDRPCVFVVYFDEHADLTWLSGHRTALLFLHPAAIPMFFFVPSVGTSPFRVKLEEIYYLNCGHPFRLYDVTRDRLAWMQDIVDLQEQLAVCQYTFGSTVRSLLLNAFDLRGKEKAVFFRLPYLRIFREDSPIATLYACLEYLGMMVHSMCLVNLSALKSLPSPPDGLQSLTSRVDVPRDRFTDGSLLEALRTGERLLGQRSLFSELLSAGVPRDLAKDVKAFLDEMRVELPAPATWLRMLEGSIAIRNVTKGHGVVYHLHPDFTRTLVSVARQFTERFSELNFQVTCLHRGEHITADFRSFVRFTSVDGSQMHWMMTNPLSVVHGDRRFWLNPYLLYSLDLDLCLFSGFHRERPRSYYKNFATGMYLAHEPAEGRVLR